MFYSQRKFLRLCLFGATVWCLSGSASAALTSLDLSDYSLTNTYLLPSVTASEASAVTYDWDTGTLFVVGDEGNFLVEVDKASGAQLSVMTLGGFDDTEGLTYIGGGTFVLVEERLRDVYRLTYTAGGSANRAGLASADLGSTVGNIGLEGISFDPRDGSYVTVKEKDPQEVNQDVIPFAGSPTVTSLFAPAGLGLLDLSDVQVLATMSTLTGGDQDNLLILSQESARILAVTRTGDVLSSFDLSALTFNAEGLTIDPTTGKIYVVAEEVFGNGQPTLFELSPAPVPVPAALPLLCSALVGLGALRRRT